jgi:hypothetical protein
MVNVIVDKSRLLGGYLIFNNTPLLIPLGEIYYEIFYLKGQSIKSDDTFLRYITQRYFLEKIE